MTPFPARRRLAELVCVLFGHEWNIHGSTSDERGFILEEYDECTRCRLENHDRAGYAARYEERNKNANSR